MHTAALIVHSLKLAIYKKECPQRDSDLWIFKLPVALLPLNLFTLHSSNVPSNKQLSDLIIHIYYSTKILSNSIKTQACGI